MAIDLNREAAVRLFRALEEWDLDSYESLLDENAVEGRPQIGERFLGRANVMGMYRSLPQPPRVEWRRIRGSGDVWVAEGIIEWGEGPIRLVAVVELRDGKMVQGDYYFARPEPQPDYHARWSERFEW